MEQKINEMIREFAYELVGAELAEYGYDEFDAGYNQGKIDSLEFFLDNLRKLREEARKNAR